MAVLGSFILGTDHLGVDTGLYPDPSLYPSPDLYPGQVRVTTSGTSTVPVDGRASPQIRVRQLPPLRQDIEIETPGGQFYRWGEDELNPANVHSGLRHSSTMPGGYESLDVTLPRKPQADYLDLERLSTIRTRDAGGSVVGEYRLDRRPSVSGDQMAITPSAVGWQAHLEDNQAASVIFMDRDLGHWGDMTPTRQIALIGTDYSPQGVATRQDDTGTSVLVTEFDGDWAADAKPICEPLYDAGPGNFIGRIRGTFTTGLQVGDGGTNWKFTAGTATTGALTSVQTTANIVATNSFELTATTPRRFGFLQYYYDTGPAGTAGFKYSGYWSYLRVIGDHGLGLQSAGGNEEGIYASDMVSYAVQQFAPLLNVRTGVSVIQSTFVVPQAAYRDPTTVGNMVRDLTRFELQDWAVWDKRTFWWYPRGQFARTWRARIAPAQLEETGPDSSRLWNKVVVQYRDVSGETRTVGPTGFGADTTDASLVDPDPANPANLLGIDRVALLTMGIGTSSSAVAVGQRFLEQSKLLDTSGRARFVGHVMDDKGIVHPYTSVRAGDNVVFVDASDTGARRIVRVEHDRASRTASVDLDAPPEGLQALLERLDVALTPFGVT